MKNWVIIAICNLLILTACNRTQEKTTSDERIPKLSLTGEDEKLVDRLQLETFNYFWDGGEPLSGAARERIHLDSIYPHNDQDVVTSGGTGFGIMATIAAVERGFINRQQAYERLDKLADFLAGAQRYHGAWPHWMYPDGSTKPFSRFDDGGDLVETAFLVQGLITARQYFRNGSTDEQALAGKMDELWREVEWDWYTRDENVLYWHWSPNHGWKWTSTSGAIMNA